MFKNYMLITIRNFVRNKSYSFINIVGLAIGITCAMLIMVWVQDELSFNTYYENAENIHRVNKKYMMGDEIGFNPSTPYPLAGTLKERFSEVNNATKYTRNRFLVKYEDKTFTERQVALTDSSFFEVFSFQFIRGNAKKALSNPNSVILTEETSNKYFGSTNSLGKVLTIDNRDELIVTGIIQNIPENSDIKFDMVMPISMVAKKDDEGNWGSHWLQTFVLLNEGSNSLEIEKQFSGLIKEMIPEEKISLTIQELRNLHLYAIDGTMTGMKNVYFFSVIAIFILAIACINFMNLSTARSHKRARETGLRKVLGANRSQLVKQFFGESIFFTLLALIISFGLIELVRPAFNELTGKSLNIDYYNWQQMTSLLIIVVLTGIISGSYPALFLSSFLPAKVLKGNMRTGRSKSGFRKILVVVQFSLSIILMIGTGIIYLQLNYIQKKDLGFNKENIVYLPLNKELRENYDAIKNQLLQNSSIQGVTLSSALPNEIWSIMRGITWEGKETDEGAAFGFLSVDFDFIETLNMEMVDGRSFSKEISTDQNGIIFNEKAIRLMNMDNPVGKEFSLGDEKATIIGVVKDFHSLPFTYEIEPLMVVIDPDFQRFILVRTESQNLTANIEYIENIWGENILSFPFEYHFLDETFESTYIDEIRSGKLFGYFVLLAIFISCLGLFGMASYTTEQRNREMGVRKVLGASITNVIFLVSKEFAKWVLIANIIAWPIAWYVMDQWLQNFAFKIDMPWWVFIISGGMAIFIALATVSTQALKAGMINPIESLKHE